MAIQKTGSENLEIITEWLISNEDEPLETDPEVPTQPDLEAPASSCTSQDIPKDSECLPIAKSIQCDDCGKLFKSQEEVEFHASKSGNISFIPHCFNIVEILIELGISN